MRVSIASLILVLSFVAPLLGQEEYGRTTELFFAAGPMIVFDEGDAPAQYGGGVSYHFSRRASFEISYSRGTLEQNIPYLPDVETGDPGFTSHYKQTNQIVLTRLLVRFSKSRAQPYTAFGAAAIHGRSEFRDRFYPDPDGPPVEMSVSSGDLFWGIDVNGGIKYFFTPSVAFRTEAGTIIAPARTALCKLNFFLSYEF